MKEGDYVQSSMFTCGPTPTAYLYESADCSGTAINETAVTEGFICNATDCPVFSKTVYDSCDKDGDYIIVPIAIGCMVNEADGTSIDVECSDGALTSKQYQNTECSGSPSTTGTLYEGCQSDDGTYEEFTCDATTTPAPTEDEDAASTKFIGIALVALLSSYLFE